MIAYARQNLYVIKTLKEFQYVDEEGKDQGVNVREKSKALASLLADDERLQNERKARFALRDRMTPANSNSKTDAYRPRTEYEEEHQVERAIEESRRMALEQERRIREKDREDAEL